MDPVCDECQSVPASHWCESCDGGTNYCSKCNESAHTGARSAKHVRITLAEKAKLGPASSKCPKHNQNSQFFCTNCASLICQVCLNQEHKLHSVATAQQYFDNVINELKGSLKFDTVLTLSQLEHDLDEDEKNIQDELDVLKARITVLREKHLQNQSDLQLVTEEKEKIGKIQQVLIRMINELTLTDVIETKNVETLRKKIIEVYANDKKIIDEIFGRMHPESVQENQPEGAGQQVQKRMEEEMWELLEEERKKEEAREKERVIQKNAMFETLPRGERDRLNRERREREQRQREKEQQDKEAQEKYFSTLSNNERVKLANERAGRWAYPSTSHKVDTGTFKTASLIQGRFGALLSQQGYSQGVHTWKLKVVERLATCMIGIANSKVSKGEPVNNYNSNGYYLNLNSGNKFSGPPFNNFNDPYFGAPISAGATLVIVLDCEAHTLSFYENEMGGVAYSDLPDDEYFLCWDNNTADGTTLTILSCE